MLDFSVPDPRNISKPQVFILFFIILCITAYPLLVGPVEFIGDDFLLLEEGVRGMRFGPGLLWDIWSRPTRFDYVPVTITTVAVERFLWGGDARLFHLTNLLISAFTATAAWVVAKRLLKELSPGESSSYIPLVAVAATLLMVLHPLNVESYASIVQLRELLYSLFGLLALRCYVDAGKDLRMAIAAFFLVILAQLSKETAVVLPGLFLLTEYALNGFAGVRSRLLLIISCAAAIGLILAVQLNAVGVGEAGLAKNLPLTLESRLGGVVRTADFIISKLFVPVGLTYDYDIPRPSSLPPFREWILPLAVISLMAWLAAGRRYFLLLLSLLPVIAISPYLNFFHFGQNLPGQMIFFDHYMLMPTFLASSLIGAVAVSSPDGWRKPLMATVIALMLLFTVYDIYLGRFWKTTETVAKRAIAISPAMPKGYFFLGMKYLEEGRYGDAKVVLSRLMSTKQWFPTFVEAYQLLGDANAFSGDYITGAGYYSQYLAYKPDDRKTLQNLSTALIEGGRHVDAMKAVETLLSLYPGDQIGLSNKKRLNELTSVSR